MECATDYESLNNVYMWLLRTFKVQQIISTTLPKAFEMHKHNGYKTQTKKLEINVESSLLRFGKPKWHGFDLDRPYEKKMNILQTQKCGNKPLNTK
jgi:hypothetical protein